MKRPVFGHRRRAAAETVDPAQLLLIRAAAAIESYGAKAMRGRGSVCAEKPRRRALTPAELHSSLAWHSEDADVIDLSCLLAADQTRALLRIVLGGPPGDEPTPLERNIIRETVERLLTATGRLWEERAVGRVTIDVAWCCDLTIADAMGTTASIVLQAPIAATPPSLPVRLDLSAVPIALDAMLPPLLVQVDSIARWRPGELVVLGCAAGSRTHLGAGNTRVASGELGAVHGRRAMLVTQAIGETV